MGIKGLYDELGTPDRIPLAKLSIDHFRKHKKNIRIGIDVAIWSFQSQAVQGRNAGSNASLRVLYYRLCTLLQLNIYAVFVFDGKERPDFKRNKTINKNEGYHLALTRRLITAFGFPIHNAPGEAEAECAYLQKQGIVDAILSEDVDTLMFGCRHLWRSGPDKGDSKSLETLQVYQSRVIREKTKLTPAGMILAALLSGGDYDTAGVAKVGMKQAISAAKAGYGEDLIRAYQLASSDGGGALQEWRERLETSMKTNHERIFTRKQPSVKIPSEFPDPRIIDYYVNPKVSETPPTIDWDIRPNLDLLREITKKKFEWSGSGKLIRTLSEKLLSWQLGHNEPEVGKLILLIHQRSSGLKDGTPDKLRITFRPIDVVPLPYDHEEDNVYVRTVPALGAEALLDDDNGYSDSDKEDIRVDGIATTESSSGKPEKSKMAYDPRNTQRAWFYEEFVRLGASDQIQMWDDNEANKKAIKERQTREKQQKTNARKPSSQKSGNSLSQKKINSYYVQKKSISSIAKPAIPERNIIYPDAFGKKENISSLKPKVTGSSCAEKTLKVVTRDSLPGAWKVISAEELDKYDDKALDDVGVWDLTNVQ
ncbi:hypothetical protein ABW20_dc0108394 [Dactylellina cionopaga]|nr:hypothetical protein ABW20_dc0108394 [Dactylellina cionopaga]